MAKLPVVSGQEAIQAFAKDGWVFDRQKGSHVVLTKTGSRLILTIPLHDEIDRGLLRHLIQTAGLTVDQFCELL
jgi:predicted RNA binding protein YcfA (HicA-like mRNA interferase family)